MTIEFLPPEADDLTPKIVVIGVGGAGGNAVANMIRAGVQGVEFLVANTDAQALRGFASLPGAPTRIQIGPKATGGLGAGSRPDMGRAAAEESVEEVQQVLSGAHMVFLAAGMGGGTGTGAAPVIAKIAREMGILTVGIVTKPFAFEGKKRSESAEKGIEDLQKYVDTLIVIPNQNLFLVATPSTTFKEAFEMADEVLQQGVRGITDLMVVPGIVNLDFADVRTVMQEAGKAMMGTGEAEGDKRAIEAAEKAIANPLLDGVSMNGARGVIISMTGGDDLGLLEVDEAANYIRQLVDPDANIIWGSAFNPDMEGKIRVSVVATGIDGHRAAAGPQATASPVSVAPKPVNVPRSGFSMPDNFLTPRRALGPTPAPATLSAPELPRNEPPPAPLPAYEPPAYESRPGNGYDASSPMVFGDEEDDALELGAEAVVPQTPATEGHGAWLPGENHTAMDTATNRRWLAAEGENDAAPARPRSTSTLFERMAGVARTNGQGDDGDAKDSLGIPRFLNRQNNQ